MLCIQMADTMALFIYSFVFNDRVQYVTKVSGLNLINYCSGMEDNKKGSIANL